MSTAAAVARSARRRITIRLMLSRLGPALLIAATGSLTLAAADKFSSIQVPAWLTLGVPALLCAGVAAWLAWRARPSLIGAAGEVDTTLLLKDQISTAMVLEPGGDPFAGIAVAQGQKAASSVRVDRAVPIRLGRSWTVWPVVLAGAFAIVQFVPELAPAVRREAAHRRQTMAQARDVSQRLDDAVQIAAEAARDMPQASEEQLASLRELQRELDATADGRPPKLTPDEAISRAAETLETAAAKQDARAEALRRETEQAQDQLDRLRESSSGEQDSPLAKAIRQGDLESARRAALQLLRTTRPPDEQTRAQTARDLAKLAEELRQLEAAKARSETESASQASGGLPGNTPSEPTPGADRPDAGPSDAKQEPSRVQGEPDRQDGVDELQQRLAEAARELDPAAAREGEQAAREQNATPPAASETARPTPPGDRRASNPAEERPPGTQTSEARRPSDEAQEPGDSANPATPTQPDASKGATSARSEGRGSQQGGRQQKPATPEARDGQRTDEPKSAQPSGEQRQSGKPDGERRSKPENGRTGEEQKGSPSKSAKPSSTKSSNPSPNGEDRQNQPEGQSGEHREPGTARQGREPTDQRGASPSKERSAQPKPGQPDSGDKPAGDGSAHPQPGEDSAKATPSAGTERKPSPEAARPGANESPSAKGEQPSSVRESKQSSSERSPQGASPGATGSRNEPTPGQPSTTPRSTPSPTPSQRQDSSARQPVPPGAQTRGEGEQREPQGTMPTENASAKPANGPHPGEAPKPGGLPQPEQQTGPGKQSDQRPQPDARPGGEQPKSGEQPSEHQRPDQMTPAQQRAIERLGKQLEKMSKQPGNAAEHEKNAERLREQARRLYEGASPEQRERMDRWMQQAAREHPPQNGHERSDAMHPPRDVAGRQQGAPGGRDDRAGEPNDGSTLGGGEPTRDTSARTEDRPLRTTPVDARSPGDRAGSGNEQVVAEWLGSGDERRAPTDQAAVQSRLREAARSAEQAIGDRTVPSRYDRILREYFRRLPEKVAPTGASPASSAPAPAAEPAHDGGSSGGQGG